MIKTCTGKSQASVIFSAENAERLNRFVLEQSKAGFGSVTVSQSVNYIVGQFFNEGEKK